MEYVREQCEGVRSGIAVDAREEERTSQTAMLLTTSPLVLVITLLNMLRMVYSTHSPVRKQQELR